MPTETRTAMAFRTGRSSSPEPIRMTPAPPSSLSTWRRWRLAISRWSGASADGRAYTLYRATNLLALSIAGLTNLSAGSGISVVASNLPATPPRNAYTDTNVVGGPYYYRLKLEL